MKDAKAKNRGKLEQKIYPRHNRMPSETLNKSEQNQACMYFFFFLFNHKAKQWKTNSNDAGSQLEDSSWKTNLFLANQISHTMSKDSIMTTDDG